MNCVVFIDGKRISTAADVEAKICEHRGDDSFHANLALNRLLVVELEAEYERKNINEED